MDANELRRMLQRHKDADTPQNEARLKALLAPLSASLVRLRQRNPQRYRMVSPKVSIEPVTLADVEDWIADMEAKRAAQRSEGEAR